MALGDFQRALADMTLDARLASAVRNGGAAALDGYVLNELESRRLHAVALQDGMSLNCSLARANRFVSIHDAFTMTCVLLGPQLRGLLDEVWSGRHPGNYQLAGEETVFAAVVEQAIASHQLTNEYLPEVFGYERICWEMAMEFRLMDTPSMEGRARRTAFHHDPALLFDALSRHEPPPPGLPMADYEVTIRVTDGEMVAEWNATAL